MNSNNKIVVSLFDTSNTNYTKAGTCVLMPLSGSVRMVAGGSYELDMVCPIDDEGKWQYLVEENIVRAPVPKETIAASHSGIACDIYRTTEATPMRSGTSEPTTITYASWTNQTAYSVGNKVTYAGSNWQCVYWDGQSGQSVIPPGPNNTWWRQIARTTEGSPILVNLKANKELYYVSGPSSGWYKLETKDGIQGYVKSSAVTFVEHRSASNNPARTITNQLFRIKTVDIDNAQMQVKVHAVHVSYDLNGVLVREVTLNKAYAPTALAKIEDGFMQNYQGEISTDLPTDSGKKYTGEIDGKSGMYALLDPDKGIVPRFNAEFRRDNWDLFVMKKTTHNRGYKITYGSNMKGVQWHRDTSNLILRVVPVAKKADGTNLYLSGTKYVESDNASGYQMKYMEWLKVQGQVGRDDGSGTATNWTTESLRTEMENQASQRFSADHVDDPVYELTIEFEMLGDTDEYASYQSLQTLLLYDQVKVLDYRTGQIATVNVMELEYDIVRETVRAVKLSNVKNYNMRSVSGYNVQNNSITWMKMTSDAVEGINEGVMTWVEDNFKKK